MPRSPTQPIALRDDPFRGSTAVARGLLTPDQLRSSAWRRLFRDVYVHRDVEVTHQLRALAAASLVRPDAVVTGCSAAVLWGVELAGPGDDVELTVPPSHRPVRVSGMRVRRAALAREDVRPCFGARVTLPEATAVRVAAVLPVDDAVVALDRMAAARVIALAEVRRRAGLVRGAGAARVRQACALADGLAESPQETRLRLLVVRGGLPAPVAQYEVRHRGSFVARVDFAWPELKVAVEYDGAWHGEPGQLARDRRRLNRLQEAGWRIVFVTAADLHRPTELLARLAAVVQFPGLPGRR